MLSQDELRRRIRAARVLADISQVEMNRGGHERGLGKHELGGAERGDIEIRHKHLPMLCEVLDVPMSWFTEPRQVIVAQKAADYAELVNQLFDLTRPGEAEAGPGRRLRFPPGRQPKTEAPADKPRRARSQRPGG